MAYKNVIMCDDEILVNSFKNAKELGAICTIHAENGELVYTLQQDIFDKGISQSRGVAQIDHSLIVNAEIGVDTKGTGNDTPHTIIDNTTIADVDVGIKAEDKDGPDPDVVIAFDVTNSQLMPSLVRHTSFKYGGGNPTKPNSPPRM